MIRECGVHRRSWRLVRWALAVLALQPVVCLSQPEPELAHGWLVNRWTTDHGLPQNSVTALLLSRDGYLWIGTFGGLARFDGVRFSVFDSAQGLGSSRIVALGEDPDGSLWIGTEDSGLWHHAAGRFLPWPGASFEVTKTIYAVLPTASVLWLGTDDGVLRLPRDGSPPRRFRATEGLPDGWVRALGLDEAGRLWAGTGAGPARLDGDRFVVPPESPPAAARPGDIDAWPELANVLAAADRGEVRVVLVDREGNYWVGVNSGGLLRFRRPRLSVLGAAEGLPAGSMLPMLEDRDGTRWLGGWCGGLFRSTGGRFEEVRNLDGSSLGCISALFEDRLGRIWIGANGLARWDGDRLSWPEETASLSRQRINAFAEDAAGTLWIGALNGLSAFSGGALRVYGRADGLPSEVIRALLVGADGTLWVGTQLGLARQRVMASGAIRFESLPATRALPEVVRDLYEDEHGALWAATYGSGLLRFVGDRVDRLTTAQGLPENFLNRLLRDLDGAFWLCGNRGIHRLDSASLAAVLAGERRELNALTLGRAAGLPVAECNGGSQSAGMRGRDGRLWFPTLRGVAVVDPSTERPSAAPPVEIEEVRADGVVVSSVGEVAVPADASRLEIAFTALSFVGAESIRFRHRLVGYDSGWREEGTRRLAAYTNVPPGHYRFEVAAARPGGEWGEAVATRTVVIAPRFYETPVFRVVLAALGLLAVWLLYRARISRLEARERRLGAEVEQATRELAALNHHLEERVEAQTAELRETRDVAVFTLAKLAEMRDGTTGEHLERIGAFSRRLGEALRLEAPHLVAAEFVEQLYRASPLHDIGKVGIPDSILRKPGPLTREERAVMATHTTIGGDALRSLVERYDNHSFLAMGMDIAYSHHERWDGGGYPRQLAGQAIPLAARIVGLVDVYDALTSPRPYKPAWPHEMALRQILAERGAHFDPALVDLFLGIAPELAELSERLRPSDA